MPWNGTGVFNRIFSWVADKAAGLDISSTRMDTDTDDIAANGFGNCLTRDGQGQPIANLPMDNFRHTGVGNGVFRTDYASLGQTQDGLPNWTIAAGSADAITATYTPALGTLNDGQLCFFRATAANATTAPTFAPNGLTARAITKQGGVALAIGDIPGNLAEVIVRYNSANTRWELLNPTFIGGVGTGDTKTTFKTSADPGWVLMNDSTIGSASSGASFANASAQALFTLFYASPFTDATCPLLTSSGAGTTRAAQGSAAAAWAANCRMTLPLALGRALVVAGSGSGLTPRTLGGTVGEEAHTLSVAELPTGITSTGSNAITVTPNAGGFTGVPITTGPGNVAGSLTGSGAASGPSSSSGSWAAFSSMSGTNTINVTSNNTSGSSHNNMQPSTFVNVMVKL